MVTVVAKEEIVEKLLASSIDNPDTSIEIDVANKTYSCEAIDLHNEPFELDDFSQYKLLNGLDDIGITLTHESDISDYEVKAK